MLRTADVSRFNLKGRAAIERCTATVAEASANADNALPPLRLVLNAIDEEKIDGRLDLAVEFLSVTCVCAADRSANEIEETAIKANQTAILTYLFDDGPMQEKCVVHFEGFGPDIRAKVPLKSKNFPYMFLEDIFADEKDGQKRTATEIAIQDYFVYSIELYANLCKGRNTKAIEKLKTLFPKQRVH